MENSGSWLIVKTMVTWWSEKKWFRWFAHLTVMVTSNADRSHSGIPSMGGTRICGWLISWKIRNTWMRTGNNPIAREPPNIHLIHLNSTLSIYCAIFKYIYIYTFYIHTCCLFIFAYIIYLPFCWVFHTVPTSSCLYSGIFLPRLSTVPQNWCHNFTALSEIVHPMLPLHLVFNIVSIRIIRWHPKGITSLTTCWSRA